MTLAFGETNANVRRSSDERRHRCAAAAASTQAAATERAARGDALALAGITIALQVPLNSERAMSERTANRETTQLLPRADLRRRALRRHARARLQVEARRRRSARRADVARRDARRRLRVAVATCSALALRRAAPTNERHELNCRH